MESRIDCERLQAKENYYTLMKKKKEAEYERRHLLKQEKPQLMKELADQANMRASVKEKLSSMAKRLGDENNARSERAKRRENIMLQVGRGESETSQRKPRCGQLADGAPVQRTGRAMSAHRARAHRCTHASRHTHATPFRRLRVTSRTRRRRN